MQGKRQLFSGWRGASMLAMLCLVLIRAEAQQTVPSGNIAAYWPLDSFAAPTTPDISGNNNTATATGTPTLVEGVYGNGLNFTGTQFLSVPDANTLDVGSNSFTVALWIKPTNMTAVNRVFNKWSAVGNGAGILFDINAGVAGSFVAGNLRFRVSDATTNLDIVTTGAITGNTWQHIVGTVNRATGQHRMFVNGAQVGTTTTVPGALGSLDVIDEIQIGELNGANRFSGIMDEIIFYSRALSNTEVYDLFAGGAATIGVGNASPVISKRGLLGQYYNNNAGITVAMTPPGSPAATPSATATLAHTRLDTTVNFDFDAAPPGNGVTTDNFFVVWTGFVTTMSTTGTYNFGTRADDCTRIWVNGTLVLDHWAVGQGAPATPDMGVGIALTGNTTYPIRVEFMEMGGNASCRLFWQPAGAAAAELMGPNYLTPPVGPDAPTGLTATASTGSVTPSVQVSWNASTTPMAATNYILSRATAPGGPYTQVAVQAGLTFTDNGVAFGNSYYYIVQATGLANDILVGPASANVGPATPLQPPVTASPTGITTSESGTSATITLTINQQTSAAATIQITSSLAAEALVTGQGNADVSPLGPAGSITINLNSGTTVGTTFQITVTGQPDDIDDGNQNYTISFVIGGGGWTGPSPAAVNGSNLDINTAGLLVNPTAGLQTTTNGGFDTFTVQLNSSPVTPVNITVQSSDITEGTVSPPSLSFDSSNWDQPVTVTVTGQGINVSYINTPYTVDLSVDPGSDTAYLGMTQSVSVMNLHLEIPPKLDKVWGGNGCGLTGAEILLPLGLVALWRRRRRRA